VAYGVNFCDENDIASEIISAYLSEPDNPELLLAHYSLLCAFSSSSDGLGYRR